MIIAVSSNVALWISVVLALIAGLSLLVSCSVYKIEKARRSEERAASLISYFYFDGQRRTLRIENKGNAEARNIRVFLDGQPLEQHHCWVQNQPNKITTLCGQGFGDYILALSSSKPFPEIAEIHWEDDVRKDNVSRSSLTI